MRQMKDSRVSWLGLIPINWDCVRVKDCFDRKKSKALQEDPVILSLARTGVKIRDISTNEGQIAESYYEYNPVSLDDILLNPMDLKSGDNCSIAKVEGVISPAYFNLRYKSGIYAPYYNYYFKLQYWLGAFFSHGKGVSYENRWTLNYETLERFPALLPSFEEQKRIAEYLDNKNQEIEALVSDIQEEIESLEECKRSIIIETVTSGLDSNKPKKKCEIDWLERIPEHWSVHPIYKYFGERKNKNRLGLEDNLLSLSYGRIIRKDINTSDGLLPESFNTYNIIEAGDIIIRGTDLQNDKRSLRTGLATEHGIITSAYIDLMPIKEIDSRYFHYLLHAYDVMKVFYNMGNGVRQGLNYAEFSRLLVIEPTYKEQVEIADYLDKKTTEINAIIASKREQLEIVEKYKRSLVYEFVTGKKEVPING